MIEINACFGETKAVDPLEANSAESKHGKDPTKYGILKIYG